MSREQEVYTAIVTPFTNQNTLDLEALSQLCRLQFRSGVHGVVVGGTTGESPTLTIKELVELTRIALQVKESESANCTVQQRVVIGIGTNNTQTTLEKLEQVLTRCTLTSNELAMVVLPYYNKPNLEGLYHHLKKVVEKQRRNGKNLLPLMVYHVPGRTAYKISASDLSSLVNSLTKLYPGCIHSVKEATGSLEYGAELRRLLPTSIDIYSGEDGLYLQTLLNQDRLYQGVVSVLSNIKADELVEFAKRPNLVAYHNLQQYTKFLFSVTSPIPAKYYLAHHRHLCLDAMRLPLYMGKEILITLYENYKQLNNSLIQSSKDISVTTANSLGNQIWLAKHDQQFEQPEWIQAVRTVYSQYPLDTIVTFDPCMDGKLVVRFFNCDGGEVEMCGNGLRCLAALNKTADLVNPRGESYPVKITENGFTAVGLPRPILLAQIFNFTDPIFKKVAFTETGIKGAHVSVGNPHLVLFVKEHLDQSSLKEVGERCQQLYQDGVNVELVKIDKEMKTLDIQIYERGVGITTSCGSGCVASAFAVNETNDCSNEFEINLPLGKMNIALGGLDGETYWTIAPVEIKETFQIN